MRPRVWAGLELPAGARGLGDDLTVVEWIGGSKYPGAPGHAAGDLQVGGVPEIEVARAPIESERLAVPTRVRPRRAADRARVPISGDIRDGCAAAFVERLPAHQ